MIYFITEKETQEYIKIGYTDNIYNRVSQLQSSNPRELLLIGTIKGNKELEKELHIKFNHLKIRGEWFTYEKEIIEYIRDLMTNNELDKEEYEYKDIVLDLLSLKDSLIVNYLERLIGIKDMIKESKQYLLNHEYERLVKLYSKLH